MFVLIIMCQHCKIPLDLGLGVVGYVGVLEDQWTRLAEIGKHSWGITVLVALQLNGPLHTFISVFAQGMFPNLHTLISESQQSLNRVW